MARLNDSHILVRLYLSFLLLLREEDVFVVLIKDVVLLLSCLRQAGAVPLILDVLPTKVF